MWLPRLLLVALAVASRRGGLAVPSPSPTPLGAQCLGSACFGLFWAARSFAEAGGVCEGGGGHLMTVRSTVAAEAIELLLRGRSGCAWLGLRLPEGSCAEPAKQLRGFRWVAGDERTDYEAWASNSSSGGGGTAVCGPRCVVVTRELSWQERACDASADGFLCEYGYPGGTCGPLPPSATALYLTPFGARESDLVALPPGTTAEVPSLGARLVCATRGSGSSLAWGSAVPGAWDCRLENGGCDGQCRLDDGGRPFCTCPENETLLEEDKRSCSSPCAGLRCAHHCEPQGDSAVCMCFEGYALDADGRSCKDVDDCKAQPSPCEQKCVNTRGGFECLCSDGFELAEGKCVATDQGQCFDLGCQHECTLVNGRYQCTCFEGFIPDHRNPKNCARFCNHTACPADCIPDTGESCYCAVGYILDYKEDGTPFCADMDECNSGYCGDLKCINRPGSYHCICPDGLYVLDEKLCEGPSKEPEDVFSGETEPYPETSVPTLVPPKDGRSRGMLIAISVSAAFVVLALVALLCYLVKKHRTAQTRKEYKCQRSETGVTLQQVSPSGASSRQRL